jgi:hypothetical protein
MAPRTRYFLVGSGLVIVIGLCTGLVAYYGGVPGRAARLTELSYVPNTASAVGYADVADILGSPFHQQLRQLLPSGDDKGKFQAETGIDVEHDIDSVVAVASGQGPTGFGGLVLVRGRFDQAKIEAVVVGHGATAATHRNVRLLIAPNETNNGMPEQVPVIAFLEPGLVAFGTRSAVEQSIDAAATNSGAGQDSEIFAAVSGVERSGNAWFVARADSLAADSALPAVLKQHLGGVRWIAVGADIDSGVRAVVRAETQDLQAAQDLRAVVNGAIAAARLITSRDARLDAALNSVQTSGNGSTVQVEFTVPAEFLELVKEKGAWPAVH